MFIEHNKKYNMFNITVKKKRGVELNSLVVFNDDCNKQFKESNMPSLASELELMYVVNDDTFRDGKFVSVVPVIIDKDDSYQRMGFNRIPKKKRRVITLLKDDLKACLSSVFDFVEDNYFHALVWRCKTQVKYMYKDVTAQYKGVKPIEEWPWESK